MNTLTGYSKDVQKTHPRAAKKPFGRSAMKKVLAALGLPAVLMASGPAFAQLTQTDVMVAARTVDFIQKIHTGELRAGIVFAPESPKSVDQANELRTIFGNGFRSGDTTLKPVMLRTDQLADADVALLFMTEGMGASAAKVAGISKARKIPCITFDLAQVRDGNCAIGVQSRPKIAVFINRKAAAESNATFSDVFRLMATEY